MKKLKVLFVGCGAVSRPWLEYTLSRKDVAIVGIVELNAAVAQAAKEKYNLDCPIFDDLEKALEELRPDIIYDLTYVTVHSQIVIEALEAGCHVFGEKPMTLTREEALEMVKATDRTGKVYNVMQNRRYQKPVRALKELVDFGLLGDIWTINADIFVGEDLASIRNSLEFPMLQDNAIHTFDQARFITGQDPLSVYCHSYNPKDSKYKGDAAGTCIFEMSKGAVFVYNCVMGTEGCNTSWESSWRIIGSKGSAIWDGFNDPVAEIRVPGSAERIFETVKPQAKWNGKYQHHGCLEEMFDALLSGRMSETDCHDNYKSISMVFSSVDSIRSGSKVKVY